MNWWDWVGAAALISIVSGVVSVGLGKVIRFGSGDEIEEK